MSGKKHDEQIRHGCLERRVICSEVNKWVAQKRNRFIDDLDRAAVTPVQADA